MTAPESAAATARHDVEHALLSLIGSLATAATNGPACLGLIGALLFRFNTHDLVQLFGIAQQIVKTPAGQDMADAKRHARELSNAVNTYRLAIGDYKTRKRTPGEPARDHIRNAQMMLAAWRALGYNVNDMPTLCNDVDARMQRALDEITRGNA